MPSLKEISQMEDEAELNSYITNFTKNELRIVWGEPNESSKTEDVWYINDNTKLIVNYHNNRDKAIICGKKSHRHGFFLSMKNLDVLCVEKY